ncbi:MAG TPA: xanthine dehydrogenase family protein molybdopterin-binding subunit [Candidatus Binatia bacterium]|nr:xanthine dehydrogenase family protein molybdopterin-binding subunit [Candidatus Binatia bacterium]
MIASPATRPATWVGAAVKRVEDPRLLRGRGRYLDDLELPGLLHAAFVRSLHAHARVRGVETALARRASGVAAVLSARDLPPGLGALTPRLEAPEFAPTCWPVLATDRVRFVGEPVAVVAAADPYRAVDAGELVHVDYEPLPGVASVEAALAAGAPALHASCEGNVLFTARHAQGDVAGAFARAAVVLRETFRHGRCSAAPIETRGLIAAWDGDALTVWSGTQVPQILRAALAAALGLGQHRVRVVVPDTGGGFGQKMHVLPEDLAMAVLARVAGRPVKWLETRRENLAAASHAREQRMEVELAADAAGRVLALRASIASDAGAYHAYPVTAALEPLGSAGILPGPYAIAAYAYEVMAVATCKPPLGAYRGVGMAMSVFALERLLDCLAERLGVDPAEVRRRNLIPPGAYPFESAAGFVYDSGDFPEMLARALDLGAYERRRREQAAARGAGRLIGIGLSCYTESTGGGSRTYRRRGMTEVPGPEAATVRMEPDGTVRCVVSFPSQGQGHATTVAQVVADALGVALSRIAVVAPDTAVAPPGSGTFASRGAVVQAGAVARAGDLVRQRLLDVAAALLEASPADLVLAAGRVGVRGAPARALDVAEVAHAAYAPPAGGLPPGATPGLEATAYFDPPGPAYAGAVHMASVEVDAETGRVRVLSYAVVEDCGPLINPVIVEGQVHGALAQGIGEALGERLVYDEGGQLLTGTLMDYAIPTAAGLPPFEVGHLETPSPITPGGYKGMGEGGTVGAPACIANAVADAVRPIGVSITALPILSETLVPGERLPDQFLEPWPGAHAEGT